MPAMMVCGLASNKLLFGHLTASPTDVCLSTQTLDAFVLAVKDMQARSRQIEQEACAAKARGTRTAHECQRVTLRALTLVQELIQKHRLQCVNNALLCVGLLTRAQSGPFTAPMPPTVSGSRIARWPWR